MAPPTLKSFPRPWLGVFLAIGSFVKNSQKTVKIATITIGVLIVTCQIVNAESAEYTKPRKRRYLAKPPSHVPGQWRQPVARDQG